jgi:hypothetical protein
MAPHTGACDVRRDDDARSMAGGGVSIYRYHAVKCELDFCLPS